MRLTWLNNGFICKELYAPFVLERDFDYIKDLNSKFTIVQRQAENAGADSESIEIIKKYKKKIIESIRSYYKADISKGNTIIYNLLKLPTPFGVLNLEKSIL